ncbi:SatD family protein [Nocardioides alkalitolerans]|uniref:SatD family protein n=1 Tax=Nocardioides alkalitolerans TaxID=281714 RepID=UPI000412C460|nr:SatD family protein [Nocardioides alkalitolerans]
MVYTLIGDLVGSRSAASRRDAQDAVTVALARADDLVPSLDGLEATVGDEFQGVYADLATATTATLVVRLVLLGLGGDARFGLGAGSREVYDDTRAPRLQDGPAWWSARAAIDELGRPSARARRGWYDVRHAADEPSAPSAPLVNAFLLCRDQLVDRLSPRAQQMLLAALEGATQREIAAALGVTESAVSQQFARGVGAVRDAQAMLTRLSDEAAP